jgi:2-polyprenyl-3-methyl-5-hydroxy-6-metoxy-1,4-benzoquinol methylase
MSATPVQNLDSAYGEFAAYYDRFTAAHDYDLWIAVIKRLALCHGWPGKELIDAACGTGKSFLPWARGGVRVRACDRSEEMLRIAQAKCDAEGLGVELALQDLRAPASLAPASLVTCLDDVLNYQLTEPDLDAVIGGLSDLLMPDGVAIFDTNTRLTYTQSYTRTSETRDQDVLMRWHGRSEGEDIFEAVITIWDGEQPLLRSRHCQRFWPAHRVEQAVAAAGLRTLALYGMSRDASISDCPDHQIHTKFLHVVTR